jgi:polyhydroxyalkanoate synthesis repressor PhaR
LIAATGSSSLNPVALGGPRARPFLFFCTAVSLPQRKKTIRGGAMADTDKPLLIKRYASRSLYNTETSDYVTLEDIAGFIRAGREVQIIDLKSGDDLTRQYLLQIVAEHESKGESVLPVNVLTDLVRSYTTEIQSVVPQFLQAPFRDAARQPVEDDGKPWHDAEPHSHASRI